MWELSNDSLKAQLNILWKKLKKTTLTI
jgi:hypothetical protein